MDEEKVSQVQSQLDGLAKSISILCEVISQVEERLTPVLRPSVPAERDKMKEPKSDLVPLAESISSQTFIVDCQSDRLRSTLSRLEL